MILSVLPKGVSMASNAMLPTTSRDIYRAKIREKRQKVRSFTGYLETFAKALIFFGITQILFIFAARSGYGINSSIAQLVRASGC